MARAWSGFLPQNLLIKEEWELLEACEAKARKADDLNRASRRKIDRNLAENRAVTSK